MSRRLVSIAAGALLAACGGGGGSGGGVANPPPPPPPPPPPSLQGVYTAQQDTPGVYELYLVDIENPGDSTKLNGTLVAGGNVFNIAAGAGGEQVIYRADQDTDEVFELYLVDVGNPGNSVKLSEGLTAGGAVSGFEVSADGGRVLYRADQDTDGVTELYLVEVAAPGASVKANDTLVAGGDVLASAAFSPDGSQVIYGADQEIDGQPELYLVEVANPGVSAKLSGAMVVGGTIEPSGFGFSPDGTEVAYIADQDTNGVNELYLVEVASPGESQKLSDSLVANGNVEHFAFSPNGAQVVYTADQDTDDVLELYLVDVATPEVSIKLNDALVAGGNVSASFAFDADGARVIYRADQGTDEVPELYIVDTAMPGASMKVNETLVAGGEVSFNFAFTPDGTRVVYGAEQDADNVRELYLVDAATPGAPSKLSAPLVAGGMTATFAFTPDGTEVVYFGDQDTDDVFEIYLTDIAAPGVSTRLNGPLAAGGAGTGDFIFLP
ncbi:MAG TPA: hypothetical protein VNQ14_05870 [Woeseiaceae bacterium]|nr:hypothetical protein [Woeseiaceae bacterium]